MERRLETHSEEKRPWTKPELRDIYAGASDIHNGFALGSDGNSPGPPDTSSS